MRVDYMAAKKENMSPSFFFSLLLHVIVLAALIVSFNFSSPMPVLEKSNVINATIVSALPPPNPVIAPVIHKPTSLAPQPVVKKPLPAPAKTLSKPVAVQPKSIALLPKKEKKVQPDKLAEQFLADLKQQKKKTKVEKPKNLAAEFAQDMKQLQVKSSLQKQIIQEQRHVTGVRDQKTQGEINRYKALVLQAISQNWIIPPTVNKDLSAELMIRVAPGGMVLDVQIAHSSGDESLDRSARTAVFKASPLPVPLDADAFEPFRQFVLKVKPKDILNSDNLQM